MAGAVAGRQERKSARGNRYAFVQLSDPSGLYEVTVFSDTLEAARDHLEPGANVVLQIEATMESEQLKLLARSVVPIDGVVSEGGSMGLKVFVDEAIAVEAVATLLERATADAKGRSRAPVRLCLLGDGLPGEVELDLGVDYVVNPQIKGAIKAIDGVVMVEDY